MYIFQFDFKLCHNNRIMSFKRNKPMFFLKSSKGFVKHFKVEENQDCKRKYSTHYTIRDHHLCAKGDEKDSCAVSTIHAMKEFVFLDSLHLYGHSLSYSLTNKETLIMSCHRQKALQQSLPSLLSPLPLLL